ncbi:MAG TPA: S41 family peptidase [Chloroflexota bacterium]|nr:S41 family peptidase [Chloroflexota bacterium]
MRRLATGAFVLCVLLFVLGTGFVLGLAVGRAESAGAASDGLASVLQRVAALPVARAGVPVRPAPVGAPPASVSPEFLEQFQLFWEAWSLLDREYLDRAALDSRKLTHGAIRGMLEALGDPHTVFLDPQQSELNDAELRGGFEGIGVHLDLVDGRVRVVAPLEGSPGEKAGLRAGDYILQVDGQDLTGVSLLEAANRIRGPRGTPVRLLVQREGWPQPRTFEIVRADIKLETVRTRLLDNGIAYVRISTFASTTPRDLRAPLERLLQARPKGLVLDLRSNPGGYLQAALDVASEFIADGVLVYQEHADGQRQAFRAKPGGRATQVPLAVLIDHGSASAAEIVAGAIRDHGRGVLVGERTFGKGTVQNLHQLADRSTVRITAARWLTPKEQPLEGVGLAPDLPVPAGAEGTDPALDRAVQYLLNRR